MGYSVDNFSKNLMGILVAVIVVMVVLIPIVNNAQTDSEDEVRYTNLADSPGNIYMDLNPMGAHTIRLESGSLTVDDVPFTGNGYFIATDVFSAYAESGTFMANYLGEEVGFLEVTTMNMFATPHHISGSVTYSNGNTQTDNLDIEYLYIADSNGRYCTKLLNTATYMIGSSGDVSLSGSYEADGNNIFYSYHDGKWYVQDEDYVFKVTMNGQKVGGTADVYSVSGMTVTVDDGSTKENFNPVRAIVLREVVGHESPDTAYTILGVIPVFVVLGIMLAIAKTFIFVKKDRVRQR